MNDDNLLHGKARRRKRAMKAAARYLMDLKVTDAELIKLLQDFGFENDEMTNEIAILITMVNQAIDGDVKAAQFLRDTAGESPQEKSYAIKHFAGRRNGRHKRKAIITRLYERKAFRK